MAYLFVLNGVDRYRAFPLEGDEVRIGKAPECEVTLGDPWISWQHARVVRDGERWRIEDLDSTNGTWRNGEAVRSAELEDEDVLFLGRTHLFVVLSDRPPSAPPRRGRAAGTGSRSVSEAELERMLSDEESVVLPGGAGSASAARGEEVGARTLQIEAASLLAAPEIEVLEDEDEAQVERDALAAPLPQESVDLGPGFGLGASFEGSTDSLFAQPAPHRDDTAPGIGSGGFEIDVGDLIEADDESSGIATLEPLLPPGPAAAPLARDDAELERLRRQLAEREEQIRRLQAELLRLKERYIDA